MWNIYKHYWINVKNNYHFISTNTETIITTEWVYCKSCQPKSVNQGEPKEGLFFVAPVLQNILLSEIRMTTTLLAFYKVLKTRLCTCPGVWNIVRTPFLGFIVSWLGITAAVFTCLFYRCFYCFNAFKMFYNFWNISYPELGSYRNWINK